MFPAKVQYVISNYMILGLVPLDKTLHFVVGMCFTILMRYRKYSFKAIFLVLGLLEFSKELIDYNTLNHRYTDSLWDAVVTFAYPALLWGVLRLKTRLAESRS